MRPVVVIGVVLLASCEASNPQSSADYVYTESGDFVVSSEAETFDYYPQPDFERRRVFRVKDQFGCDWWMEAGSKFDGVYPVLGDEGEPVCPPGAPIPAKTTGYREKPRASASESP